MPSGCVYMVGGLINNKHIGSGPQCTRNLESLLLSTRERVIPPRPLVSDGQLVSQLYCCPIVSHSKVFEIAWRFLCALSTICREKRRAHNSRIRLQKATHDTRKCCFSGAVFADKTSPARRKRSGHIAYSRFSCQRIRIFNIR